MQILFNLFFYLFGLSAFANCDFRPEVKRFVSLSGITTTTLRELGLLNHPKLQGVSLFSPITKNEFSGKFYPGGIFLSRSSLDELREAYVFFDESRELGKILRTRPDIIQKEVKTRNQTPQKAVESTLALLLPIIEKCEDKIKQLHAKISSLEAAILAKIPNDFEVIFYLGAFQHGRPPEMVIANDGIVKWLVEKKAIKTYPTGLAYVNWSSRIMNNLSEKTLHVGIKDSGQNGLIEIRKLSNKVTLIYPGSLVPGVSQLEAILYWLNHL